MIQETNDVNIGQRMVMDEEGKNNYNLFIITLVNVIITITDDISIIASVVQIDIVGVNDIMAANVIVVGSCIVKERKHLAAYVQSFRRSSFSLDRNR